MGLPRALWRESGGRAGRMSGPTCVPGVVKKEEPIETPVSQMEKPKQGKDSRGTTKMSW